MKSILKYYALGVIIQYMLPQDVFIACSAKNNTFNFTQNILSFFEYGEHVDGEEESFTLDGVIPAFTPRYTQDVTPNNTGFEEHYSYLKVQYISLLSQVTVKFDPKKFLLRFSVKFPFLNIPFRVVGYSPKIMQSSVWNAW